MLENFIKQIKALLAIYNQEELALELNVSHVALNRWVNGHAKPHRSNQALVEKLYKEKILYPNFDELEIKNINKSALTLKRKFLWKNIQNNKNLLDELVLEHSYNSNTIEGGTFTKRQTEAVLFDDRVFPSKDLKEHRELVNHALVLREIFGYKYPVKINQKLIKNLHAKLMYGLREDAGEYSKHHRDIRGLDLSLCRPKDIADEMESLIEDYSKIKNFSDLAKFHIDFELIHPFGDGNGRVGRFLMTVQCLNLNLPPIIISEKRKIEYYDTLYFAQTQNEGAFVDFVYEGCKRSSKLLEKYKV